MTKYTEVRTLSTDDLRRLCNRMNWFTQGNNEQYDNLFKMCDNCKNITTDTIIEIATYIKAFSNTDRNICNIAFEITRETYSFYKEV